MMTDFEMQVLSVKNSLERYVQFKINNLQDAQDILQEVYLQAFMNWEKLYNKDAFKPWILQIARNKCNDFYRKKSTSKELSLEIIPLESFAINRNGIVNPFNFDENNVQETISHLTVQDKQIIYMFFFWELSQNDIAKKLKIPLGTVKSRLYNAKKRFKTLYTQGGMNMKALPKILPKYKIIKSEEQTFPVKWEELMGWFLVPKLKQKLNWGIYEIPTRTCSSIFEMEVVGKAIVHGIEGVRINAIEKSILNPGDNIKREFVAQLTDKYCRYLAEIHEKNGVQVYNTFLDEDDFMSNWGFGENNCGNQINIKPKGKVKRNGNVIEHNGEEFLLDIVGRYKVILGEKEYDTICVMDIETCNNGVVSEQFLDKNGRTILWRRFNRDNWNFERYNKLWSEQLPSNERLTINGQIYVHWYDCITDYIQY